MSSQDALFGTLKIGSGGSCGAVYRGVDTQSQMRVAIKVEEVSRVSDARSLLKNEIKVYNNLIGCEGFPHVYWSGESDNYRVLVFELLGPTLYDMLRQCGGTFSLKTILMLADQLICRLQQMHAKGHVHQDVKPENILIGTGENRNTIYLSDMGLAARRPTKEPGSPPFRIYHSLTGTTRFASISAHKYIEQTPRDDLECLGYTLVYCIKGCLPWQNIHGRTDKLREAKIYGAKKSFGVQGLCEGLPEEFQHYFHKLEALKFNEEPDYNGLRGLFAGLSEKADFRADQAWDWENLSSHDVTTNRRSGGRRRRRAGQA
ncbi:kinase-like domain-containing protein [Lineolata rhizophorae]|uniref:Kinase-like domain-containing protein n=1 Tax=Lineolata rhizophorae TaxID=578093 RepID=A0A6A6NRM7_9PEZI|nr:kinase-like domain-containing protein [Lineolata rhizophorae]